ncbi:hypothetical protein [Kiritimatiella glycovorans]|uniref:Uncharacterized protein n=1 Tax=Kiritimatiella glycovorans TaxID=1307763 RepID=A0A0G3EBJ4_9BACT|nr:hypothetical protein [Kiritimatiella glycovorans]AKJ63816.1 hypothetical protein L21SP4_00544 [Kiritimatiella glycovorans]
MKVRRKMRKKPMRRPIKSARERRRRLKDQRRRLVELGMSEEDVARLNNAEIRERLRRPAEVEKQAGS